MRFPPLLRFLPVIACLVLPRFACADDMGDSKNKRIAAEGVRATAVATIKSVTASEKDHKATMRAQIAQLAANLGAYTPAQIATIRAKWKSALEKSTAAVASLKAARIHDREAAGHMINGNGKHKLGVYNDMGMVRGSKWHFDQTKSEYDGAKDDADIAGARVSEIEDLLDEVEGILGPP